MLDRLACLLDVAGVTTPWEEVAKALDRGCSARVLRALEYRVERARSEAFEEGSAR